MAAAAGTVQTGTRNARPVGWDSIHEPGGVSGYGPWLSPDPAPQ